MGPSHLEPNPDIGERYAVLLDIGRTLTATLQPAELYRAIYEQTSRVLETTGFYISLYDESTDAATIVFYADRGEVERTAISYRGSESIAIREARPVLHELEEPDRAIMLLGPDDDPEVTRSFIAAPMLRRGRVLGTISAQSYRAEAYTEADLELLAAVAGLAAVALQNALSVEEMDRRRREAEQLEEVGRALTSSLELADVLDRILEAALELTSADGAGVWLFTDDGTTAEIAVSEGSQALPPGTRVHIPQEIRAEALAQRRAMVFDFTEPHPLITDAVREMIAARSGIAIPLVSRDRLVGALSVTHLDAQTYPEEVVRLLERFGYHVAVAIANARMHESLLNLSLTDPLTALPNRRHMDMFLAKEFAAAQRGRALTVVMFDLDHFKAYNDEAGHQAGDEALRAFGAILRHQTRAMNLAVRYGGDEFLCILSDTDDVGGHIHAGRIIEAVDEDPILESIGVSYGLATYSEGMEGVEDLIRAADVELYREKERRDSRGPSA